MQIADCKMQIADELINEVESKPRQLSVKKKIGFIMAGTIIGFFLITAAYGWFYC